MRYPYLLLVLMLAACNTVEELDIEVYETSAAGNQLTALTEFSEAGEATEIKLKPDESFQTITGFGGSFTESSAYLLN